MYVGVKTGHYYVVLSLIVLCHSEVFQHFSQIKTVYLDGMDAISLLQLV